MRVFPQTAQPEDRRFSEAPSFLRRAVRHERAVKGQSSLKSGKHDHIGVVESRSRDGYFLSVAGPPVGINQRGFVVVVDQTHRLASGQGQHVQILSAFFSKQVSEGTPIGHPA